MEKVSRYLVGSSNINRFYKVEDFPSFKPCVMQKCCNIETFKVLMEELDDGDNEVMISVIENFICDEVNGEKEEKRIDEKVKKAIDAFLRVVQVTAERLKKNKIRCLSSDPEAKNPVVHAEVTKHHKKLRGWHMCSQGQ